MAARVVLGTSERWAPVGRADGHGAGGVVAEAGGVVLQLDANQRVPFAEAGLRVGSPIPKHHFSLIAEGREDL